VLRGLFESRSLVLASADGPFDSASDVCRSAGVPCIYITEYSLKTRLEIVREHQPTVLHGWWRSSWERRKERSLTKAISISSGVQCNGTPTYQSYRSLTPRPMLFFDSRIEESMQARPEQVEDRWSTFQRDRKLRLLFSGRLNLMKGVDHLPLVAAHLRKLGVPFEMSICGDGDLAPALRAAVEDLKLSDCVKFRGVLDFKTQLVPRVTQETDLFVCCHRQGDPSCTYLETMSCGVPIVGYANEALQGLVETSGVGWVSPLNRPTWLAEKIASIYSHPEELKAASLRSLAFARDHTFDKTFRRRIEHLDQVAESCSAQNPNR
jgi:glycosyltransferase involved in cell wall biosynthesis